MYIVRPILLQILYIFYLFYCRYCIFSTYLIVVNFWLLNWRHFVHFPDIKQVEKCTFSTWLIADMSCMFYMVACRYAEKREKASQILNDMDFLPKWALDKKFHISNKFDYRGSQTRALHKFIHHHNSLLKRTWWKFIHHHRPEERYSILLLGEAFNWPKSVKNIDPQDDCNIKRYRNQKIWKGTTRQPSKIEWREMFVVLFSPSLRWCFKIMFWTAVRNIFIRNNEEHIWHLALNVSHFVIWNIIFICPGFQQSKLQHDII